jgi:serine/threonine protein phosphatase PrpC
MSNSPDANGPRPSGLQAMLARLTGAVQPEADEEVPPTPPPLPDAPSSEGDDLPLTFDAPEPTDAPPALPDVAAPEAPIAEIPVAAPVEAPAAILCPICAAPRVGEAASCHDCGYYFSSADLAQASAASAVPKAPAVKLQNRFELGELISERHGVARHRGLDHGDPTLRLPGSGPVPPVPVVILRQQLIQAAIPAAEAIPVESEDFGDEIMPSFDDALLAASPATEVIAARSGWPNISWERALLTTQAQPGLPRIVAGFQADGFEYLVEEVPQGRALYDAWDDPDLTTRQKYGLLAQVAETMHSLHQANAMLEALRPDLVVVTDDGHARLTDLSDLLPLPIPADAPLRGTLYTAPELMAGKGAPRSVLYSFGGLLYSLHVGRELQEIDFDQPGNPKPFVPRFPDVHPAFGRLVSKSLRREPDSRFPTDEASKDDPSGFVELIRTLNVLGRTMDLCRLEIAAWTTTGMVRTGNEDAFALLHACESRQDDSGDAALLLLADGMGGYEAGEVAAALAIQIARQTLTQQKPFTPLAGQSAFPTDPLASTARPEGHAPEPTNVEVVKQQIKAAIKEANRQVFAASRAPGNKRRGMGCTLEVVYVDGRNVIVGHVGDSRTYHLHEGRLVQLTRDQTLVNRLVELGTLTPEEAETHPRRNELQQAIGGQPDVEPGIYHGVLKPGDWVLVCSDGLTNHINSIQLKEMMLSEAASAEMAARRLVNFANIEGATDNATVVVVRAT